MSYIFDRFPSEDAAMRFKHAVDTTLGLGLGLPVTYYASQAESDDADPFPFELTPPIVHVYRNHDVPEHEEYLEELARSFGGQFAGT